MSPAGASILFVRRLTDNRQIELRLAPPRRSEPQNVAANATATATRDRIGSVAITMAGGQVRADIVSAQLCDSFGRVRRRSW